MTTPFATVLVANRGEVARRILRTCRALGIATVAVHSHQDADALHVGEADRGVELPGPPVTAELDVGAVVAAAVATGADAIHPGYGFLSENPALPRACRDAGITFVGPSAEVIALMGDKSASKAVARRAGVPVLGAIDPSGMSPRDRREAVADLGLPVLVKAVAGGGGKGMRRVDDLDDLEAALSGTAREAASSFGDARVLVERFVTAPRHVEVQVAGDEHGGAVHLFDRDCSVQRRHQKVVEEAPAPGLDPVLRDRMGAAAVALVAEVGYTNLGTVEFLVDPSGEGRDFFFLEMNTRLQVEHPVTEAVTGLDLVACQLALAAGGTVPDVPGPDGHAIEVRLYAEDVAAGSLPQSGTLDRFTIGPGVRVDAGVEAGSVVTPHYDPLLAKVIAHGPTRAAAIRTLADALGRSRVTGIVTNLQHLSAILAHPVFVAGEVTTDFLDRHLPSWQPPSLDPRIGAATVAALALPATDASGDAGGDQRDPWATLGPWRSAPVGGWGIRLGSTRDTLGSWLVTTTSAGCRVVLLEEDDAPPRSWLVTHRTGPDESGRVVIRVDDADVDVVADRHGDHVWLSRSGHASQRLSAPRRVRHLDRIAIAGTASLVAPMPGTVVAVPVGQGDAVDAGTVLVVIEAMKMEHPVVAPGAGTVTRLDLAVGDPVVADQVVVEVVADGAGAREDEQ